MNIQSQEYHIHELRRELSDLNIKILNLLTRRNTISMEVMKLKQQSGLAKRDMDRVDQMLRELKTEWLKQPNTNPKEWTQLEVIFRTVFESTLQL